MGAKSPELIVPEDELRRQAAAELGLPENTSWDVIHGVNAKESRRDVAAHYGLPEGASWAEIHDTFSGKNPEEA